MAVPTGVGADDATGLIMAKSTHAADPLGPTVAITKARAVKPIAPIPVRKSPAIKGVLGAVTPAGATVIAISVKEVAAAFEGHRKPTEAIASPKAGGDEVCNLGDHRGDRRAGAVYHNEEGAPASALLKPSKRPEDAGVLARASTSWLLPSKAGVQAQEEAATTGRLKAEEATSALITPAPAITGRGATGPSIAVDRAERGAI